MTSTLRRYLRRASAISWTLLILVLCWTPSQHLPQSEEEPFFLIDIPHLDKIIHGVLFCGFSVLWSLAGAKRTPVLIASVVLAVLSELGQLSSLVGRDATLPDVLADLAGGVVGVLFMGWWRSPARSGST